MCAQCGGLMADIKNTNPPISDLNIAWLAGIIEGEGCISYVGVSSVAVTVGMTDKDIVERILEITKIGVIYITNRSEVEGHEHWKTLYQWRVANKQDVLYILKLIHPWMGERRSIKIDEALDRLDKNPGPRKNRPIQHGTRAGYRREISKNIEPCEACVIAMREHGKLRRIKEKEKNNNAHRNFWVQPIR